MRSAKRVLYRPALLALLAVAMSQVSAGARSGIGDDRYADLVIGVPHEDLGAAVDGGQLNVLYGAASGLAAEWNHEWHHDLPGMPDSAEAGDQFGAALASGDFNGDGYPDLAVGAYREDVGLVADAGAVTVLYGSASGLSAAGSQQWTQDSTGLPEPAEEADNFGYALAAGDFNQDGADDLAIGVRGEDLLGTADAGAVAVLYGGPGGLSAGEAQIWSQDSDGVPETAEGGDQFGDALAAADFNGDGFDDLVVGTPMEDLAGGEDAGLVNVFHGSAAGLVTLGSQAWSQGSDGLAGAAEPFDYFGHSLTAADFNADGYADLAVGAYEEDVDGVETAGAVTILYGAASGLTGEGSLELHQDTALVPDAAELGDRFAYALAAGDFDADGFADLAAGVPWEEFGTDLEVGALHIFHGSADGLTTAGSQFWSQDTPGIPDQAEHLDYLGWSLAAGDLNGDGYDDLAAGVSFETVGEVFGAGAVNVLYGGSGGLSAAGSQLWHQESPGIAGDPEDRDNFGWSVAVLPARQQHRLLLPFVLDG